MNVFSPKIVAINIVVVKIKYSVTYFGIMAKGIECNKCQNTPYFYKLLRESYHINHIYHQLYSIVKKPSFLNNT